MNLTGSMQDVGSLGMVHWDDPEGWYGEGGGRGIQDGEHVYPDNFLLLFLFFCQKKANSFRIHSGEAFI